MFSVLSESKERIHGQIKIKFFDDLFFDWQTILARRNFFVYVTTDLKREAENYYILPHLNEEFFLSRILLRPKLLTSDDEGKTIFFNLCFVFCWTTLFKKTSFTASTNYAQMWFNQTLSTMLKGCKTSQENVSQTTQNERLITTTTTSTRSRWFQSFGEKIETAKTRERTRDNFGCCNSMFGGPPHALPPPARARESEIRRREC